MIQHVNGIRTVFRDVPNEREKVLFPTNLKKATSAQQSLLNEINHHSYTADRHSIIIIDNTPVIVNSILNLCHNLLKGI